MPSAGVDAMLITDLINVRYLTGFTGSNAALLVFGEVNPPVLATDSRYRTQAARQAPDLEVAIERACGRYLADRAAAAGSRRIGFESHVVTVDGYESLCRTLSGDGSTAGAQLVRASGLIESLREVKDDDEVVLLRAACQAADAALASLLSGGGLRPGRTERAVARELESHMLDHGADARSFETIVAAGPNSAVPHHRPTDAELRTGDFVKIDFGALVDGYHSDMTRTFVLGAAADWQREIYELVLAAQRCGVAALESGADLAGIDGAARRVIDEAGFAENFGHGLGHGVGLQIHEAPGINAAAVGALWTGSVVTVEPGVYLPGRGGVRIEDSLVVTSAGAESLTTMTRELLVLG